MILAFLKFLFSRTNKNGTALRREVLKRMQKKQ